MITTELKMIPASVMFRRLFLNHRTSRLCIFINTFPLVPIFYSFLTALDSSNTKYTVDCIYKWRSLAALSVTAVAILSKGALAYSSSKLLHKFEFRLVNDQKKKWRACFIRQHVFCEDHVMKPGGGCVPSSSQFAEISLPIHIHL